MATVRPDRAVVKKAIADAGGSMTKAASLLGCSRQTLYTWIYQHGLERYAGIRPDRRSELDMRERQDTRPNKSAKTLNQLSNQAVSGRPPFRLVEPAPIQDFPVQATMRLPGSLWKRVKIEAIREGLAVSEYVRKTLEAKLAESGAPKRKKDEKGGGER